ncbi:MAG: DUF3656 domain-containing protein [Alphaproteobacteria bacterium]|nr:DUF3656 domain-containing protein [Alphaproteobacteria bacterium]
MVELLAPAGQVESGYAAFAYGADAVYLGLTRFSARAEAENFTPGVFDSFVRYAHENGKKVLTAVNTVFFENEKADLIETLQIIDAAGADGVIVQDLGTARLIKKYFPALRLHASTQMAVHNREGAEALRDLGFKRVVLARELTLDEIEDICRVPGIEKEVFIHGALCYCYSGLCLFSSIYAGRSANRGKCVYPCRELFNVAGESKHVFSMKDMAQGENVRLLEKAGVTALKIEGRKKSPLYVSAVTDYYRSILNGETNRKTLAEKRDRISCIFSRPTTELYLKGRRNFNVVDPDIVGHRGLALGKIESFSTRGKDRFICFKTAAAVERYDGIQIDLPRTERPFGFSAETLRVKGKSVFEAPAGSRAEIALPEKAPFVPVGAAVYLSSSGAVKKAYPCARPKESEPAGNVVSVVVVVKNDFVSAEAEGVTVSTAGSFSAAKSFETAQKAVSDAFSKTGGTGLVLGGLTVENSEKLFVPLSVLNELRRRLYEQAGAVLAQARLEQKTREKENILKQETFPAVVSPSGGVFYSVKTDDPVLAAALIREEMPVDEIVFELSPDTLAALPNALPKEKIRFALPAVARAWETESLKRDVQALIGAGYEKFEIGNVWGLSVFKGQKVDLSFDWPVYAANSSAARALADLGASGFVVSPETPDPAGLFAAFPDLAAGVVYQDPPLFISETCPYAALDGKCQKCGGNRQEIITSRYGEFVSVMKNCRHFLLSKRPVVKKREMLAAGAKRLRVEFMRRSDDAVRRIAELRRLIQK